MITIPPSIPADVAAVLRSIATQIDGFTGSANVDLKQRRLMNAGPSVSPDDYVTRFELDKAVLKAGQAAAGSPTGSGSSTGKSVVRFGTHATRLTLAPINAALPFFYETDRGAIYAVDATTTPPVWSLLAASTAAGIASRPTDLTSADAGFTYYAQDQGLVYTWSGAAWHTQCGNLVGTYASRPAPSTSIATGVRFTASDKGYQEWVYDRVNSWWTFAGGGEPERGAIASLPTLGTHDGGYLYYSTDFDRVYRWDGSAWGAAPGQDQWMYVEDFYSDFPGNGWALCNGATVTRSKSDGTTTSVVLPDLTTSHRLRRPVSGSTGGLGGNAQFHTHQVDPPNTTTSVENNAVTIQNGTGGNVNVAQQNHTHTVDIAAFASAVPSGTAGEDAMPPYADFRPYMRI